MPTKPWRDVQNAKSKRTLEERAASASHAIAAYNLEQMTLAGVRRAMHFTQETIAATTGISQSEVSQIERRTDAYIGTVRRFVEATGGELKIIASYPTGTSVEIVGFGATDDVEDANEAVEHA